MHPRRAQSRMRALSLILSSSAFLALSCTPREQSSPHFKRGAEWIDLGRFDAARQEFRVVISEEPKNAEARFRIADSYAKEGNHEQALAWGRETLTVKKNHGGARKLLESISSAALEDLGGGDIAKQSAALRILDPLVSSGLLNPTKDLLPPLALLLSTPEEQVAKAAFEFLRKYELEAEPLEGLAKSSEAPLRMRALAFSMGATGDRYLGVLRVLLEDTSPDIYERAALELLRRTGDRRAKEVLAERYRDVLSREIEIGKTDRRGVDLHDRIGQIAQIASQLDAPFLAGLLAELICNGRVYGFLATGVAEGIRKIGEPGRPYVEAVLARENEFRRLLASKGLSDVSQVDWRFQKLR